MAIDSRRLPQNPLDDPFASSFGHLFEPVSNVFVASTDAYGGVSYALIRAGRV